MRSRVLGGSGAPPFSRRTARSAETCGDETSAADEAFGCRIAAAPPSPPGDPAELAALAATSAFDGVVVRPAGSVTARTFCGAGIGATRRLERAAAAGAAALFADFAED
jgi:hypothetical protein